MSRRGNCYDNAAMESFFGSLKKERVRRRQVEHPDCLRNRGNSTSSSRPASARPGSATSTRTAPSIAGSSSSPTAHLERFGRDAFDYIVVDEFHHAAAPTYRRLIDWFRPIFLLGLTATPERTDGGDLLAPCQENLA